MGVPLPVNVRFPGQYADAETGLHYNYFRDYDPETGRYIESDPIGIAGGLNTYEYALGNPVRYTDSSGAIIDILADAGFVGYDVYRIFRDNVFGSCDNLGENLTALGADLGAAFIPGLSGAGLTVRGIAKSAKVNKNSLEYVGETHVYRIIGPDGKTFKIGESAQGTRVRDGASIRAEQQVRRLTRETGDTYTSEIRRTFPDKASARDYETRVIERFRRLYGDNTLPGNKTNR